jgi:rSAM/selenodomain-associated transferase 1
MSTAILKDRSGSKKAGFTLVVFTKNAKIGSVKTRIAQVKGNAYAYKLHNLLLDYLKKSLAELEGWKIVVYYSDSVDTKDPWPKGVEKKIQVGNDLGERMFQALEAELKTAETVMLMGSDVPDFSIDLLTAAKTYAADGSLVLGPSTDGGYYLIGGKSISKVIFDQVIWGSDQVLAQTIDRINLLGVKVKMLPELADIDLVGDIPPRIIKQLR